ncbi:heparinase II/III family protein [Gemmobacter lanyuensis]
MFNTGALMIDRITLQALARLSPRMVAYHMKRLARNKLCRVAPNAYAWHIERVSARVQKLVPAPALPEQSLAVAAFYNGIYAPYIDNAAAGQFVYFAQHADFGNAASVNWHHTVDAEKDFHLWRQKFGHMGFICPMLIHGNDLHLAAVADLLARFREQASFSTPGCFSSYWFPYSVSHRILAILSGYLVARNRRSLPERLCCEIEEFLRFNIGFVLANIEHELNNNHVERNLAALCFYYSNVPAPCPTIVHQLDRNVTAIIQDTILSDGMSVERSAMYQGLSVMSLQVFAQTPFLSPKTRVLASERLKQAIRAWHFMAHPDGDIALFNDSWLGEVPKPSQISTSPKFAEIETLDSAGYARLCRGDIFALFDAGPIGPSSNPGHGHADFLSIEVDVAGTRFIVDPGTYQYSTGPRRMHDRAAAEHNGPAARGLNP